MPPGQAVALDVRVLTLLGVADAVPELNDVYVADEVGVALLVRDDVDE